MFPNTRIPSTELKNFNFINLKRRAFEGKPPYRPPAGPTTRTDSRRSGLQGSLPSDHWHLRPLGEGAKLMDPGRAGCCSARLRERPMCHFFSRRLLSLLRPAMTASTRRRVSRGPSGQKPLNHALSKQESTRFDPRETVPRRPASQECWIRRTHAARNGSMSRNRASCAPPSPRTMWRSSSC